MKRSEAVNQIQILLESRGYVGNGDDGEAVMEYLESINMGFIGDYYVCIEGWASEDDSDS